MAIEHDAIVSAERHEPKGIESASSGQVYIADGANSGAWSAVSADSVDSTGEQYGKILTTDGSGGSAWAQKVWKDLVGVYQEDISGPTRPTKASFIGTVDGFAFSVGDSIEYYFHMPHDYAVGTDIYLHTHWGHQGTTISGNLVWDASTTLGCRNATAPYAAFTTPVIPQIDSNAISGTMNITNYPQHCHVVEEIQLSSSTPTATQLDTTALQPDCLIMIHLTPSTIPTISGGTTNEPFLFTLDIHYQADCEGTLNKDPNFYV